MNHRFTRFIRAGFLLVGLTLPAALPQAQDWEETDTSAAAYEDEAGVEEEDTAPAETDSASRKIIGNHVLAMGGMDAIKAIRSYRATGTVKLGRNENDIRIMKKAPAFSRHEVDHAMRYRQTGTIVQATNGEYAWSLDGTAKNALPQPLGTQEAGDFNRNADFYGPLIDWEAKGIQFTYEGKDDIRGRPVYVVKGYFPGGARDWFYFDAKSFLLLRHRSEATFANARRYIDTTFTGFKKLAGTYFPMTLVQSIHGQEIGCTTFETVEPNVALEDTLFQAPRRKEVWLRQDG